MSALPERYFTEQEYLTIERAAEFKSDYVDGKIYAMAGAGYLHGRIIFNWTLALGNQLVGRNCSIVSNDLRVRVAEGSLYTYPDIVVHCGEPRFLDAPRDTLLNPQLIVEVLSPSTEDYDRGLKSSRYRQIDSLTDYVMVAQTEMLVEHWSKQATDTWTVRVYRKSADRLRFESLAAEITLADIYNRVEFSPLAAPPPSSR